MRMAFVFLVGLLLLGTMFVNLAHATAYCEQQCCEVYDGEYVDGQCTGLDSGNMEAYQTCASYCNSYYSDEGNSGGYDSGYDDYGYDDYGHTSCCAPAFVLGIALLGSYLVSRKI